MRISQKDFDRLIAISSSMNIALKSMGVKTIVVETCHGEDEGKIETLSLNEIDDFIESVFESEVE